MYSTPDSKTSAPGSRPRTRAAAGARAKAPSRARADKLSISLGVDDVRWIARRAKRLGTSASAVIAEAIADKRRAEARDALLEMLGKGGVTDAELAAARREAFGG